MNTDTDGHFDTEISTIKIKYSLEVNILFLPRVHNDIENREKPRRRRKKKGTRKENRRKHEERKKQEEKGL